MRIAGVADALEKVLNALAKVYADKGIHVVRRCPPATVSIGGSELGGARVSLNLFAFAAGQST